MIPKTDEELAEWGDSERLLRLSDLEETKSLGAAGLIAAQERAKRRRDAAGLSAGLAALLVGDANSRARRVIKKPTT